MANVSPLKFTTLKKLLPRFFNGPLKPLLLSQSVIHNIDSLAFKKTNNDTKFELTDALVFSPLDVRPKCRLNKPKLKVFVHFDGCLGDDGDTIVKHRTKVSYTLMAKSSEPQSIKLIKGSHYDYDSNTEVLHPFCHMQEDIHTLYTWIEKSHTITNKSHIEELRKTCLWSIENVRVPTVLFDLFSAIIMILADHCIDRDDDDLVKEFKLILDFINKEMHQVPIDGSRFNSNSLLSSMDSSHGLRSDNFYSIGSAN